MNLEEIITNPDTIKNILDFILNPEFKGNLFILRISFLLISLVFAWGIFYFLRNTSWFGVIFWNDIVEIIGYKPLKVRETLKKWKKINKRLQSGNQSEYKLAIIEGDSLLDYILKRMGHVREANLEERLYNLDENVLSDIDKILETHKISNDIINDPDYKLSLIRAKELLLVYEKALDDLHFF